MQQRVSYVDSPRSADVLRKCSSMTGKVDALVDVDPSICTSGAGEADASMAVCAAGGAITTAYAAGMIGACV